MNTPRPNQAARRRRKLVAAGGGLAAAAIVTASAASLGGLSVDRIGAEDAIVASPIADGASITWGEPELVDGEYVISQLTFARSGVQDGDVLRSSFSALGAEEAGSWWTSSQLNLAGGTATIDPAEGGLVLHEGPRADSGAPRPKAGALYYTGLRPLADVANQEIRVDWLPLGADTPTADVLVQFPIYLGSDAIDVFQTTSHGSPIFGAHDDDAEAFFLNPASSLGATGGVVDPDSTLFRIVPNQPYLSGLTMPMANPGTPGHDPATYGVSASGLATAWTGTIRQLLANFPEAKTPGVFVSLSSNASLTDPKHVVVTDVAYGASEWSFAPAPNLPAADIEVTIADASGVALATGTAVSDGSANAVVVTLSSPIAVADIARVAAVVYE